MEIGFNETRTGTIEEPICAECTEAQQPFTQLQRAIQSDFGNAWGWQSNIAMAILDSGVDVTPRDANIAAANVMKRCFDVDVTDSWEYRSVTEPESDRAS